MYSKPVPMLITLSLALKKILLLKYVIPIMYMCKKLENIQGLPHRYATFLFEYLTSVTI